MSFHLLYHTVSSLNYKNYFKILFCSGRSKRSKAKKYIPGLRQKYCILSSAFFPSRKHANEQICSITNNHIQQRLLYTVRNTCYEYKDLLSDFVTRDRNQIF